MKRTRFTDEQIIGILKEQEAGAKTVDVFRKQGVSDARIYRWKAKFGGVEVSEVKRLKTAGGRVYTAFGTVLIAHFDVVTKK